RSQEKCLRSPRQEEVASPSGWRERIINLLGARSQLKLAGSWVAEQVETALSTVRQSANEKFGLERVGTPGSAVLPRGNSPGWPSGRARTAPATYRLESKKRKKALVERLKSNLTQ